MLTQVIGLGVVGKAQAFLLSKLGHKVYGYDIRAVQPEQYFTLCNDPIQDVDISFICTPENAANEVIEKLKHYGVKGLIVIKSTVPVGTINCLMKDFDIHICYNPEFLRGKCSFEDVLNPRRIVIGECCSEHGNILKQIYKPLGQPIYRTDPTTGELIKLVSNSLRAVNISFWNQLYLLCRQVDADIKIVAEAADSGKVLGEWEGGKWGTKRFGEPYDGKCLDKDLDHLFKAFCECGVDPSILEATKKFNEQLKEM